MVGIGAVSGTLTLSNSLLHAQCSAPLHSASLRRMVSHRMLIKNVDRQDQLIYFGFIPAPTGRGPNSARRHRPGRLRLRRAAAWRNRPIWSRVNRRCERPLLCSPQRSFRSVPRTLWPGFQRPSRYNTSPFIHFTPLIHFAPLITPIRMCVRILFHPCPQPSVPSPQAVNRPSHPLRRSAWRTG